jgi:hypothetical protein
MAATGWEHTMCPDPRARALQTGKRRNVNAYPPSVIFYLPSATLIQPDP